MSKFLTDDDVFGTASPKAFLSDADVFGTDSADEPDKPAGKGLFSSFMENEDKPKGPAWSSPTGFASAGEAGSKPAAPAETSPAMEPFDPKKHKPTDVGLGGLSTEYLITERSPDGKVWNIPSIWWDKDGKPVLLDADQSVELAQKYEKDTGNLFPRFESFDAGVEVAKERSAAGGATNARLATPENPDGVGVSRAIGRGALRTAASLPRALATADAQAIGDSTMDDAGLLKSVFLEVTRLPSVPEGADISTPEKASAAIANMGYPADYANIFRGVYDKRKATAEDARSKPDEYIERGAKNLESANSFAKRAESIPMSAKGEEMKKVFANTPDTFGDTVAAIADNPVAFATFLGETAAESGVQLAAGALTTLITRSPTAGSVVLGAGAVAQEYDSSVREFLQERNIPMKTREDAINLLNNADLMKEASERGVTRGLVIAAFEMVGQGAAAKTFMKSPLGNIAVDTLVQGATGSGGEAAARLATGQDMSAREILIEGLAEGVTAPIEVGIAAKNAFRKGKDEPEAPPTLDTVPTEPVPTPQATEALTPDLDPERVNSDRLSEDDRRSPIRNDIIDDGKAVMEQAITGNVPDGAVPSSVLFGDGPAAPVEAAQAPVTPETDQTPPAAAPVAPVEAQAQPDTAGEAQVGAMEPAAREGAADVAGTPPPDAPAAPAPLAKVAKVSDDVAVTVSGKEVPVSYAIVEAADLVTSQTDDGRTNAAYPAELQPRDRSRNTSADQIRKIASKLNPKLLDKTAKASDGAPIVSASGVVESGNGRTLAIRQAYSANGPQGEGYRAYLAEQGYPVDGFERPVLVRIRQGEMTGEDLQRFTVDANERDNLGMSATERAMADAGSLSDNILPLYRGGDIDSAGNRDFVRKFIGSTISENDQAGMIDANGQMSQDAVRRVQAALLAKAYGDADLVAALVESTDSSIKAIGGALLDVSAAWAQMRAEATAGTIDPASDMTDALLGAVRVVDRARRAGRAVSEFVGQRDIFSGDALSEKELRFLSLFFRDTTQWTRPSGRAKIADALGFYVTEARKTSAGVDLLGESADPTATLTKAKERQYDDEQTAESLFSKPAGDPVTAGRKESQGRTEPDTQGAADEGKRVSSERGQEAAVAGDPERGGRDSGPRQLEQGEASEVSYEDVSEKAFVVKGISKEEGAIFEGMKARPLWNAKRGGWVFSKKRRAEVEDVIAKREAKPKRAGGKFLQGMNPPKAEGVDAKLDSVTAQTLKSWKSAVKSTGTVRGWTVFDDREVGTGFVLMSDNTVNGPFADEASARAWAADNPAKDFWEGKDQREAKPEAEPDFVDRFNAAKKQGAEKRRAEAAAANTKPTYVYRPVLNSQDIVEWAREQGFKSTLAPEDMHVTVTFSKEPVDRTAEGMQANTDKPLIKGGMREVEQLGDAGAIVLRFEDAGLKDSWQKARDAGASWDFPSYQPHVTITYKGDGVDLSRIDPYPGPIILGAEVVEDINEDAGTDVKEQPTAKPETSGADGLQDNWQGNIIKTRQAAKTMGISKDEAGESWSNHADLISKVQAKIDGPKETSGAGPRVFVNKVGRDGKTDAERGGPLESAKADEQPVETVGVSWADADIGDMLPMSARSKPVYLARKKMNRKALAQQLAEKLGGSVTMDGMKAWGVIVDRKITKAESDAALAEITDTASEATPEGEKEQATLPKLPNELAWVRSRPAQPTPRGVVAKWARWFDGLTEEQRATMIRKAGYAGQVSPEADLSKIDTDKADAIIAAAPVSTSPTDAPKPKPTTYGANNQLVSSERAAILRERFKEKLKNQLNAGIDPELLAIGTELTVYHIEAGARRFADLAKAISDDLGVKPSDLRKYLRSMYVGAQMMMEDSGIDVSGMDAPETVTKEMQRFFAEDAERANVDPQPDGGQADAGGSNERDGGEKSSQSTEVTDRGRISEPRQGRGEARSDDTGSGQPTGGQRDRAPADAGRNGARSGDRGTDSRVAPQKNHIIEKGGLEPAKGAKTRARNSLESIRVLKQIEAEGRLATAEEKAILARFGGAGTLAGGLKRSDGTYPMPDIAKELLEITTDEEYATIERTSQYAFYTAEDVLRSMWSAAAQLGFKGGNVYEPGMGVGGFAGTIPAEIRGKTNYQGLELDNLTARIAKLLYPESSIQHGDFIKAPLARNHYDLVIGNPPFAGTKIKADPDYPQGFMLHDYFFAKSLDAVRPGGLLMFVTSAGTMNKGGTEARDYLADRADLVGSIRLPSTAFKDFAGTEVTTDIVILRKRLDTEAEAGPSWRQAETVTLPDKDGGTGEAFVNQYFIDNPDMILGEQGLFDTLIAGPRIGVRPRPGSDLRTDLRDAVAKLPEAVMTKPTAADRIATSADTSAVERKTGGYYFNGVDLYQFDGRVGKKVEPRSKTNTTGPSKDAFQKIKGLVSIKDALRDVYAADTAGKDGTAARKKLNTAYEAFTKKHGPINKLTTLERRPSVVQQESARQKAAEEARMVGEDFDIGSFDPAPMSEAGATMAEIARARSAARDKPGYREGTFNPASMASTVIEKRPNIDFFMADPESYRLRAIEKYDEETKTAKKGRVFTENAIYLPSEPKINSPEDALLWTLAETGRVDLEEIARLSNSTVDVVRDELGDNIFRVPNTTRYETKESYLSGNVRRKLREAKEAAKVNPTYEINVSSLENVIPMSIEAEDIAVRVGASWFPANVYLDFARSLGLRMTAKYQKSLGVWSVHGSSNEAAARTAYGTDDLPFGPLMSLMMNNKPIKVTKTVKMADGTKRTETDAVATEAANEKALELRKKFSEWFWSDDARKTEMAELYNDTFNAEVAPKYDGAYLTTPGINGEWRWRAHQTAVIARILQSGNTYMAHAVGAGKTSAMIGAGMEAKRLGMVSKPMYVVPNHMLAQFSKEFYEQYPLANIAIADEARFHTSTRKQFIADVAMSDLDAVIITHSAFQKIPVSEAFLHKVIGGLLKDVKAALEETPDGDRDIERSILNSLQSIVGSLGVKEDEKAPKKTRKKIEQLLEAAEQKIAGQTDSTKKDQVFDFDDMGVDMLFVDEAHLFRKLSFNTQLGNLKGVDAGGSMAAMDLFIKTRFIEEANPGRGLIFASGTPITNTMAELYSLSRFMQEGHLEERGLSAFDAWAQTFGETESSLEPTPDGSGYKEVSRFAKFVNGAELSLMVRQIMDVVTSNDLGKYVTRPALKGGERNMVVLNITPEMKEFQQKLSARMTAIENRTGPVKKGDDIILSVINDGRLAAIDMRLVDPTVGVTDSKLERLIQNVYSGWEEGKKAPLYGVKKEGGYTDEPVMRGDTTQIVFSTLGVNPSKHNPSFSVHEYIRSSLIRMGVPREDIILASDLNSSVKKQRAFNDMNEGKKRILIGSKGLFTGVNAQKRMAQIHNLDPLWYPADDEQRNGRGIRQGNMNREIAINDYSVKGTYDSNMWGMMGRKAKFIEQFFNGDPVGSPGTELEFAL